MVSVSELSKKLNTSVVTIRKDLKLLAEQQLLTCVAGGAIPYQETAPAASYSSSFSGCSNLPLKRAVAQEAAKLISDGDSLIITSGSTPHLTLTYAAHAQRKRLKILTDSLKIAMDFCHYSDYQVIILGGEIYAKESFIHGRDAVRQASLYMADKAILTMDGVDADEGLTAFHVEGANTLQDILSRAKMRIIVADITKIGVESFCNIGPITLADVLVTNKTDAPEKLEILERIAQKGVEIRFAEAIKP